MSYVISINLEPEVHEWLMRERDKAPTKNLSRVVNFFLRGVMEKMKSKEPQPETEKIYEKISCPICGAIYSSKLPGCPGCSLAEIDKREAMLKAEEIRKETTKEEAKGKIEILRQRVEEQEKEVNKCREIAKSISPDIWETSQEKKELTKALVKYERLLQELYSLEALKNEN